jgi:hypothetical protein
MTCQQRRVIVEGSQELTIQTCTKSYRVIYIEGSFEEMSLLPKQTSMHILDLGFNSYSYTQR